jgi:hypothetical protein
LSRDISGNGSPPQLALQQTRTKQFCIRADRYGGHNHRPTLRGCSRDSAVSLRSLDGRQRLASKTPCAKFCKRRMYVPDYSVALVFAALGDKDQAFALLDKSYRDHSVDMLTVYYDPFMDNLRSDPRLADLERRVGLK